MIYCPFVTMVGTADDLRTRLHAARIEARYAAAYSLRSGHGLRPGPEADEGRNVARRQAAVELGFADEVDGTLARATTVSKAVLSFNVSPWRSSNGERRTSSGRTQAQRDRLRKRLQLIAMQARFGRDPKSPSEKLWWLIKGLPVCG